MLRSIACALLFAATLFCRASAHSVTTPPESFFDLVTERHRDAARAFYKKHLSVGGMPVVAAQEVDDRALHRTQEIVTNLLAGRPDILQAMVSNRMYLIIIGKDQVYTDMPEYSSNPNPAYMNERVRGTGGRPTSFGEENVLSLPIDRYDDESIGVHEFLHTIDSTLASIDPTWRERKNGAYRKALAKGLWKNTYAAGNPAEFWAEVAQSYFDCNRVNNWNHGPIRTREELKAYDPETYELVRSVFQLKPEQDWRYSWLQPLPNVIAPPEKFQIDPWYKKFTWAREFHVLGRDASDAALLKVNDTIRKMFAYRHDLLKALMAENARLVVLAKSEKVSDLPEVKKADHGEIDLLARALEYAPGLKLMALGEELASSPRSHVIALLARAVYDVTAHRPVDPDWDKRGREVQQYELRVERLDERFGARVKELHTEALERGKWKGTPALNDPASYFVEGVLAYFDAAGQLAIPNDAPHPIATRELLRQYDPALFSLIEETMAYKEKADWRYSN